MAAFTGVAEDRLVAGIDGCSAPNYAVPLASLAPAFARLATADVDPDYGRAPRTLADAMIAHPEMVSGEHRSDLALMRAGRGDWVTKIGAEGVQAIGVRSRGSGIAIKVADGQKRGLYPAIVAVLEQLGAARRRRPADARPLGPAHGAQLPRHGDRRSAAGRCTGRTPPAAIGAFRCVIALNLAGAQWSVAASVRRVASRRRSDRCRWQCRRQPRPPFGGHNNDMNQGLPADG